MRRLLVACAIVALALLPRALPAQCYEIVDVSCPLRTELTLGVGPSTEQLSVSATWTTPRRFGLYGRIFPGLVSTAVPEPNSELTVRSAIEYGVTYRVRTPLTLGIGFGRLETTTRTYAGIDPITGRPSLIDQTTAVRAGPALIAAWAFHPPRRPVGFALALSAGRIGSGGAIATTLRFPRRGAAAGTP